MEVILGPYLRNIIRDRSAAAALAAMTFSCFEASSDARWSAARVGAF